MYVPVFRQISQEAGNGKEKEKTAEQAQLSKAAEGRYGAGGLSLFSKAGQSKKLRESAAEGKSGF